MRRDVKLAAGGWHRHAMIREGEDPTGNVAAEAASMPEARRVRMIEAAAADAGGHVIGRAILRNVTEGIDYWRLRPPCGDKQFYRMRLVFFVELDRRMWEWERRH